MMLTDNPIIDPLIRELMEQAAIGEAAKLFLQSELGGHVARKAAEDVEEAMAKLCECDPNDAKTIAALQLDIRAAKGAIVYLSELMTAGEHARRQIDDES